MRGRLRFMTRTKSLLIVFVAVSLVGNVAFAKRNTPPKSFVHDVRHRDEIDQRIMAPVNVAALLEEDAAPTAATVPVRAAYAVPLDLGIDDAGTWETHPNGGS